MNDQYSRYIYILPTGDVVDSPRIRRWRSGSTSDYSLASHAATAGTKISEGRFGPGGYAALVRHAAPSHDVRHGDKLVHCRIPLPAEDAHVDAMVVSPTLATANWSPYGIARCGAVVRAHYHGWRADLRRPWSVYVHRLDDWGDTPDALPVEPLFVVDLPGEWRGSPLAMEEIASPYGGHRVPV